MGKFGLLTIDNLPVSIGVSITSKLFTLPEIKIVVKFGFLIIENPLSASASRLKAGFQENSYLCRIEVGTAGFV